jgi:hypothetical protein
VLTPEGKTAVADFNRLNGILVATIDRITADAGVPGRPG